MKDIIYSEIKSLLGMDFVLEKPKDKNLAHYATPVAFCLAKEFKKAPALIAKELADKFDENDKFEVSALNGYLNFRLKPAFLDELASKALELKENFASQEPQKTSGVLLEYISANPTGPLHIGHVRGAVYGDTLQRVSNYLGYKMDTEYYINDAGNQIELLGVSVALRARELLCGEEVCYPQKYYRGEYIDDIATLAQEKFGKEIFYDDLVILAEFAKDEVLKIIKKDLQDAGVNIENFVSEVALYPELTQTINKLAKSGQMYEDDGKIWIASSKLGDEKDRVVVRENSKPTYLAGDIVYHNNKFERGYDSYINIWGADHHGYIPRLKAAINFLGYDESKLEVILMQMVNLLKDGQTYKMSKRAGNSVLLSDVLSDIGKDAMRFMFISKNGSTPLEFDVEDLKKEDSTNPVFYINYAHARVNQIFAKAQKDTQDTAHESFDGLGSEGLNLAFEALRLNEVLNDALASRGLHKIPDYLKSLAAQFHKYYNENHVVGSQSQGAQLKLFAVVALSIRTAFSLMGLSAKSKMTR